MVSTSRTTSSTEDPIPSSSTISQTHSFLKYIGITSNLPESYLKHDVYSDLIRGLLQVNHIERGQVTCTFTVKPQFCNIYGSLHGGAIAAIAELVMEACVKSVVEKDLFLGEFATSYISAAGVNAELEVGGVIVRQGRNVTVTSVEFRIKETKKLVYTARATFYNVPVANL
ncbi:hypothetical protein AQUCO_01300367v1 [Aquilegia coerulea]|uniref:Thioesterase domain-containing protein n=1 Tax=Aquilegia coerulea TaxID=218851 RepID=A0A2G5E1A9_AQUCA|nr:hypothetical protein AQUCO_01300367v1 [Aquilegia coerulea]PIA49520.1 hypothetical protein AQUCO_01300367v1 [Aquilegia coerulea]